MEGTSISKETTTIEADKTIITIEITKTIENPMTTIFNAEITKMITIINTIITPIEVDIIKKETTMAIIKEDHIIMTRDTTRDNFSKGDNRISSTSNNTIKRLKILRLSQETKIINPGDE